MLKDYAHRPEVLIGHQYSTILSVLHGDQESDIHAMTGREAAVVGLDFLSLIGAEGTAPAAAKKANREAARKALRAGSRMTLSCHFPNFAYSNHILQRAGEDGRAVYDFSQCSYYDAKILKPCAVYILEPGETKDRFYAALDLVADYCLWMQELGQALIFRPFHEDNGDWFWWGQLTDAEDFRRIWASVYEYLERKGVRNLLYAYSPNGPIRSEEQYLERYPGDAYVDVLGFDYYDDCLRMDAYDPKPFLSELRGSCQIVQKLSEERGKIPAVSETGVRIRAAGADSLLPEGNPVCGADWYEKVLHTASETGMSYLLFWGNYAKDNFFVPYPGHEMEEEFMRMAQDPLAVFAGDSVQVTM